MAPQAGSVRCLPFEFAILLVVLRFLSESKLVFLLMAKCDQGYICDVCGSPVEDMADSDLYLRYIAGQVAWNALNSTSERHIRCNPVEAQFIVDADFEAVEVEGDFAKQMLSPDDRREQEEWITQAWRRLQEVVNSDIPIIDYPLKRSTNR